MSAIFVPAILVNDVSIPIKANSVKYSKGLPEYKIRIASAGGSRTETVFTKDIETAFSMISFSMLTTKEAIEFAEAWKLNENTNVVQWVDVGIDKTFNDAAIINKIEVNIGVDGDFEVTFNGSEAI